MKYPGLGDPAKRKKTLRFLAITAIIAISVGVASSLIQGQISQNDPLKVCINDRDTRYVISVKLELYVDKNRADIPANIGFEDGCQRTMYTIAYKYVENAIKVTDPVHHNLISSNKCENIKRLFILQQIE